MRLFTMFVTAVCVLFLIDPKDPVKNGGATDCCTQQFSRGFWTLVRINIRWDIPRVKYTHDNEFI